MKKRILRYLNGDGASQGVEIFEQFPDSDLVPGIFVLLSQDVIVGEIVKNRGPAIGGSLGKQVALRRRVFGRVKKPLEDLRPRLPQRLRHRRMVHSWPQVYRLSRRRLGVGRRRRDEGREDGNGVVGLGGGIHVHRAWIGVRSLVLDQIRRRYWIFRVVSCGC